MRIRIDLAYLPGRVKAFGPFHPLDQNKTCTNDRSTIRETKQIGLQQN